MDGAKATETNWLRPSTDKAPRMQAQEDAYGFRYAAIRRPIHNAATHEYVRSTVFVAPASALIPPNDLYNVANINTALGLVSAGLGVSTRPDVPRASSDLFR